MTASLPTEGVFRTDFRSRAAYAEGAGIFRMIPQAVAVPGTSSDVAQLLNWAQATGTHLIPRGAGSAMGGGNVGTGVVVDLTRLDGAPLSLDASTHTARAGAAVSCDALNRAAAHHGLRLPPDPSSSRWATLGGMISTNASGSRSLRYGSVRAWVRSLVLATVDGEILRLERGQPANPQIAAVRRFQELAHPAILAHGLSVRSGFPKVHKNSSGYALDAYLASGDLLDLVIGSEGTLGVVTEATWRLDPIPTDTASLRVDLADLDRLQEAVHCLRRFHPATIELLDRTFLDFVGHQSRSSGDGPGGDANALLLVEFEADEAGGASGAAIRARDAVAPLASRVHLATNREEIEALWQIRHAASPILAQLGDRRRSLQVIEDGCVPLNRLSEYIQAIRHASQVHRIEVIIFGHAGDGHVHANLLPDVTQSGWELRLRAIYAEVVNAVARLGGTLSGEHGDGRLRTPYLDTIFGAAITGLFRRVKDAFDPTGVLNPGVKVPDGTSSLDHFKVGPGAAVIPADIEAALRRIEQAGGYAQSRLELADPSLAGK